ncbi:uncharacterized protein LOC132309687 [Cornus florida]|uniref:uncharacterized protein LOC132309687 n=1 Tax=Cornus florida TaxID=4283 RepID=UPI00289CC286|nr:uncharacterized protein LOC132309687 [Cornus florida]
MEDQSLDCRQDLSDRSMSLLSSNGGNSSCPCAEVEAEAERTCAFNSIPDLPKELIVEILCRLPKNYLIRSKSIICGSDSDKFTGYAPYPLPADGVGCVESYLALLSFDHIGYDLQECCNGLLLFARRSRSIPGPVEYYVCNPATKQCVAIPINPTHLEPKFAVLAFDPSESLHYKIVYVSQSDLFTCTYNLADLDMFSSDTGKWVTHAVPLDPADGGFMRIKRGVYFSGVLYLLAWAAYLVSFDIKMGMEMEMGNVSNRAIDLRGNIRLGHRASIGVSEGCFYYSNHDYNHGKTLCIWSLNGGEWTLRHSIGFPHFSPHAFHPTNSEMIFLGTPF